MATDGRNSKSKTVLDLRAERLAKQERWSKASLKQKKNWTKFKVTGLSGFARGSIAGAINRLQAMRGHVPLGHADLYSAINSDVHELILLHKRMETHCNRLLDAIELEEDCSWHR